MPATQTALPIRYSRVETMEAHISYLRAKNARDEAMLEGDERTRQYQRLVKPCGETEMRLAIDEMRRLEKLGRRVSFDEALEALRAGYR